jgi:hypothetical protein
MDRIVAPGLGLLLSLSLAAPFVAHLAKPSISKTGTLETTTNQPYSVCNFQIVDPRIATRQAAILHCQIVPLITNERLLNFEERPIW